MGGKKSKAPATPDYSAIAAQQGQENRQIAQELTQANRPNQYDAFGNAITWTQGPNNSWSQNVTMSPELQSQWQNYLAGQSGLQNLFNQKAGAMAGALTGGFQAPQMAAFTGQGLNQNTWGNLNDYGVQGVNMLTGNTAQRPGDWGVTGINPNTGFNVPQYDPNAGKSVADALYGSVMDRGRVEQQRETDTLTTQLRQQGLQPGTAAFDRAMQNLRTSQNDANLLAAQNATLAGGQEARDIYGARLAGNQQMFGQLQGANQTNLGNMLAQNQMANQNVANYLNIDANNRQNFLSGMSSANQAFNQNQASAENNRANYETWLKGNLQDYTTRLGQYNQAQQDLGMLQGLAGSPMAPQFASFGTASGYTPADMLGAANATFGANMGKYNSSQSKKGGGIGSGLNAAATLFAGKI